jgi:CubicO group peptidase (beta-lactamase class C family)
MMLNFQVSKGQNFSSVDALVEQRKNHFGGKMIVMLWKDTVLYQKITGETTINTQGPIGCSSAWLTAALAMFYVDQGKISLDDPVAKYLPIFAQYAKSYLTIRHCLANTTGIDPEKGGIQKIFQKTKFPSLEEEVNSFSRREIKNNPGEVFYYNNIGTNIVGRILEIVGKKSFDRLMLEKIFRPLGMKRSTFASETAVNPFSGGVSTPSDYLKFQAMLLNKGTLGTKKILSESSVAEMQKIQTGEAKIIFVPKQVEGYAYGLGNWIQSDEEHAIYTSPSLSGVWPYIDTKRKYAFIIFGDSKDKEDKKDVYLEIMHEVQELIR